MRVYVHINIYPPTPPLLLPRSRRPSPARSSEREIIGHPFHHAIMKINLLLERSSANSQSNPVTWGIILQLIAFTQY